MKSNFFKILTFLVALSTGYCATFTVYEDPGRTSTATFLLWGGGASEQFTVDEDACMNFNFYNDKISSIDPQEDCVKIWEHAGCTGASMIVTDNSGCSRNLAACDISRDMTAQPEKRVTWDNAISSISTCSAAEETQANRPADNGDLEEYDLLLLNSNKVSTAGGEGLLNVISLVRHSNNYFTVWLCKHVDCKRQESIHAQAGIDSCANFGGDWDRQVSAVYNPWYCVELFDDMDCEGESIKFIKSFNWFSSPELNPCRKNLSRCGWDNRIRSVRRCAE